MKEGVLDRIMGRKSTGEPMTAQEREKILDGYVAFLEKHMPNVSREEAVKIFVDGGDPYLTQGSKLFDQDLLDSLMGVDDEDDEEDRFTRDQLEQDARLGLGPYADDYAQIDDD